MGRGKVKTQRTKKSHLSDDAQEEKTLQDLESLADKLDIEIRYERGDFTGGFCRVGEKHLILLQKNDPAYKKVYLLARELGHFDLDDDMVVPAIKKIIESEKKSKMST